jgi:hypothetical protein
VSDLLFSVTPNFQTSSGGVWGSNITKKTATMGEKTSPSYLLQLKATIIRNLLLKKREKRKTIAVSISVLSHVQMQIFKKKNCARNKLMFSISHEITKFSRSPNHHIVHMYSCMGCVLFSSSDNRKSWATDCVLIQIFKFNS